MCVCVCVCSYCGAFFLLLFSVMLLDQPLPLSFIQTRGKQNTRVAIDATLVSVTNVDPPETQSAGLPE